MEVYDYSSKKRTVINSEFELKGIKELLMFENDDKFYTYQIEDEISYIKVFESKINNNI